MKSNLRKIVFLKIVFLSFPLRKALRDTMAKGSIDPYDLIIRERDVTRAEKRLAEREADLERRERVLAKASMTSTFSNRSAESNHAKHLSVINTLLGQQFHSWVYQNTILPFPPEAREDNAQLFGQVTAERDELQRRKQAAEAAEAMAAQRKREADAAQARARILRR